MCHRRTNKESVLSADVGPPETNIIYGSKCNMSIYIIIGGYITGSCGVMDDKNMGS